MSIVDLHDATYALGCTESPFACEQDLAISESFFQNSAFASDEYILELRATNGQNATGICYNILFSSATNLTNVQEQHS